MRSQLNPIEPIHLDTGNDDSETRVISIDIPEDFIKKDLVSRIMYVANQLKSHEAEYPSDKGELIRHTALIKVEGGKIHYAVTYVPYMDNEY